jgi:integrase
MRIALTDRFVASAKPGTEYFDAKAIGLSLVPLRRGGTWYFHFSRGGRRGRVKLGTYPAMPLAAARTAALEARATVEGGGDPTDRSGVVTVGHLVETYIAKHLPRLRRPKDIESRLRRYVLPAFGSIPLAELHRRDINAVIDRLSRHPAQANAVFANVRAMLRWAMRRGDLDRDPIAGMKAPNAVKHRDRVLSDAEIRTVWAGLGRLPDNAARVLRLCLLTAQRIGEVTGMTPRELDLNAREWRLPSVRTKNKHPHSVPLSHKAIDIIGPDFRGFGISALDVTKLATGMEWGIEHWTPHDLRRTALTGMARLGVEPIVLGHIANHRTTTKAGMTLSVYVVHGYEAERRRALELWADRLAAIVSGKPTAAIVALSRA